MLKAGYAKACITPPVGTRLTGFSARQGVSTGVHDDLFARALVLDDGGRGVALVSVEVLGLDAGFVARVCTGLPIPAGSILVAATHTHSGPVTLSTFYNPDESVDATYMALLENAIRECVTQAWRERFPARLGVGAIRVEGVGLNRRAPGRLPVDEDLTLIKIADERGRTRFAAVHFTCHPTVLGPNNLLVTGDFPAETLRILEQQLDGSLFLNGALADVSMGHSPELSALGVIAPGRTFEKAAELGGRLAEAALRLLPEIETAGDVLLASDLIEVDLPAKNYPPMRAEPTEPLEQLYAAIDQANSREAERAGGRFRLALPLLRIGDLDLLGFPGELFVEIGLRLKRAWPRWLAARGRSGGSANSVTGNEIPHLECLENTEGCAAEFRSLSPNWHHGLLAIVGPANGYEGYLCTSAASEEGGYEARASKFAPEAEQRLVETLLA